MDTEIESPVLTRVRELIVPIASDLGLDLYDLEQRGGTLRVTLDTPPGAAAGVSLDVLSLASRLVSKELDQHDPIPSRYTLEVTSPGVERTLRNPGHFQREVGKLVAIRLADVEAAERRTEGVIVSADEQAVTLRVDEGGESSERLIPYRQIDRARTVFEWGPQPKPGQGPKSKDARSPATTTGKAKPERASAASPAASSESEAGSSESAASSESEAGSRRSGAETRFGTAAAPAASPPASNKERVS